MIYILISTSTALVVALCVYLFFEKLELMSVRRYGHTREQKTNEQFAECKRHAGVLQVKEADLVDMLRVELYFDYPGLDSEVIAVLTSKLDNEVAEHLLSFLRALRLSERSVHRSVSRPSKEEQEEYESVATVLMRERVYNVQQR